MESLLATYAASDDEDDEQPQPSASKRGGSMFSSLPQPKRGGLEDKRQPTFSSLPQPKRGRLVDDEDDEQQQHAASRRAGSMFSSLPQPKKGPGKRTVEFRPPIDMSVFAEAKPEKRGSRPERKSASGPTGGLVLPPPKNTSLGVGAVLGGGSRLTVMESAADAAEEPAAASHVGNEVAYPEAHDVPSQGYEQESSWNGGLAEGQWEASSYSQGWDYATANPSVEAQDDPVAKALRSERRKGKEEPVTFIQIKQEDLTANRPREDQLRLTGIAFGSAFGPKTEEDEKNKPSKLHRRKHQIGSLLYDARSREFELIERRARGQLSKSQTQAKYGW